MDITPAMTPYRRQYIRNGCLRRVVPGSRVDGDLAIGRHRMGQQGHHRWLHPVFGVASARAVTHRAAGTSDRGPLQPSAGSSAGEH
jgi:hypothetical protein